MSLRMRLLGGMMRPVVRHFMARVQDPRFLRRNLDLTARFIFRKPPGTNFKSTSYAAGRAVWVSSGPVTDARVLLYVHGGGYLAGSPDTHKKMIARLCRMTKMRAFLPAYRLAPENPAPAALEDIMQAWTHLRNMGWNANQIVIGGDSAGGGIALALLAQLCQLRARPAGVFAWSPFTDQTFSGASVGENGRRDHFFPGEHVHRLASMILGDTPADDPRVSPLYADFPNPPPVLIQASTSEILRDDAMRMEAKLRDLGSDVRLEMWENAPHVWQLFDGHFPEAREAITNTAIWITSLSDR